MRTYLIKETTLSDIADSIRSKTGKSDPIQTDNMAAEIQGLTSGGGSEQLDGFISDTLVELDSNATILTDYGIYNRSLLESVNFPKLTRIEGNGLAACSSLKIVNAPVLARLDNYALTRCSALPEITLPSISYIGIKAFSYCTSLKKVDVGKVVETILAAFSKCSMFDTLIVRAINPPSLNSDAFGETPIESGSGYIYVPSASLDAYKQATNWTVYADQILAIEDYPEITGGAV